MKAPPSHGSPGNRNVDLDPDRFYVCQRCTACCRWPGQVKIGEPEIQAMSALLGLETRLA